MDTTEEDELHFNVKSVKSLRAILSFFMKTKVTDILLSLLYSVWVKGWLRLASQYRFVLLSKYAENSLKLKYW